jgi:hypothetical protein
LERDLEGLGEVEVSLYLVVATVIGGGVVKPRVGKSSEVLGLNHGTISGESGVTRISPSSPRLGEENSIGTLPKFNVQETPIEGITVE